MTSIWQRALLWYVGAVLVLAAAPLAEAAPWQFAPQTTPYVPFGSNGAAQGGGLIWIHQGADAPGGRGFWSFAPGSGFVQQPDALFDHWGPAVAYLDGYVYFCGGGHARVERYSPGSGWQEVAAMPAPKNGAQAAALGSKLVVFGGYGSDLTFVYDPAGNAWTTAGPMQVALGEIAAAVVGSRIYAMGGLTAASSDAGGSLNFEYFEEAGGWHTISPGLPELRGNSSAVARCGVIYLMGGRPGRAGGAGGTVDDHVWTYDTATNGPWQSYVPMQRQREDFAVGVFDGIIYAIAGRDNFVYHASVETNTGGPVCEIFRIDANCNIYTCLNSTGEQIVPSTAQRNQPVSVTLDYDMRATNGHIIFAGIALDNTYVGTFYNGVPGQGGVSGAGNLTFAAPMIPGNRDVRVVIAHVYTEQEMIQAVAAGEADALSIGSLSIVPGCGFLGGDVDGDGVCGDEDNCPSIVNPDQANWDGDAIGDACDPDIDNDGVPNETDVCDYSPLGRPVDCCGRTRGDMNGDCLVNGDDIQLFANVLLGL